MRQTLFRVWLERPWAGWTEVPGDVAHLGAGWVALVVIAGYGLFYLLSGQGHVLKEKGTWIGWAGFLMALTALGLLGIVPASFPIFGYGAMVLIGFAAAIGFSWSRAKAVGYDPDLILDASFWLLIAGILGGRMAYLIQYADLVFRKANHPGEVLFAFINLAEGGLVLIGALVGGFLGFLAFCIKRKIDALDFADLIIPAVFIGIGFGRIGCLLNGCCFGDRCELPWAITFPEGSLTYEVLAERGFVDREAPRTIPLHPTQIYSSLNGFLLAVVTGTFYWYRKHRGVVFGMGCILYPLARIQLEFLRADEMGQLGTGLTISQLYSLGILLVGVALVVTGRFRPLTRVHPFIASPEPV
ncbi:MAG: prolipoprotein diacylglyceryl transferase [Planctomycetaceae bacterium]|nr:prolipoprotein diacylglyceryl transferase [Planctomycetaceae bacterium]